MANTEGILFGDLFISNRELFVDFFIQYYQENQAIIEPVINNLNQVLQTYNFKTITPVMVESFSSAWKRFQQIVLLNNKNLQLIVGYRGASGRDAVFSQIIDQEQVEGIQNGVYGIKTGDDLIKDGMKALQASNIEKFLQYHLNGMLTQLDKKLTSHEAYLLHKYHTNTLANYYQEHNEVHLTGLAFRNVFYGSSDVAYFGGQKLGQVYDAFMNHLANHEKQIFNYLASNGQKSTTQIGDLRKNDNSVYTEENEIGEYGHFPILIQESKNHTGWWTGGDIIIINPETMDIVYNIQLKTTTEKAPSVFREKISQIRTFIESFIKLSPKEKGERLFDFFLTSVSNRNDFNILPQEEVDSIIKKGLETKINNLSITIGI